MQNQTGETWESLTSHLSKIADRTQNVLETVDRAAIQTQAKLNEVKTQAINCIADVTQNVQETSDRAGEKLLTATDNIQRILEQTIQKTEAITNGLNNEIQAGINAVITNWLAQHPIIAWILEHPLLTLILVTFSLLLVLGAIKAVFQVIEKLGGGLINFPWMAVGFLLNRGKKPTDKPTLDSSNTSLSTENLAQIIQRLEALEKTQQQILQQLYKKPENN